MLNNRELLAFHRRVRESLAAASAFLPRLLPRLRNGETTVLTHLSDPGHGWLVVPEGLARDVIGRHNPNGIRLFSGYSYRVPTTSGPVLLLEEDCDASLFLAEWKDQPVFGPFTVANVECPETIDVRSLPSLPEQSSDDYTAASRVRHAHYEARERAARAAEFNASTGNPPAP